jgi:uncharacterized SAM-binding protein YcdF (DUF218 family)
MAAAGTVLVCLALLLPIGAVCQIVLTSQLDDRSATSAIVVLDPARYWGDPAPVLSARLEHAAELYAAGTAPVIVVTGPARTAKAAREELIASGVPAADVVAFTTGADTVGALQVVATIMRDLRWESATLVTDPPHAARAEATAAGFGIDAHLSPTKSGPGTALTSEYVGRETAALLRFYLLTRWDQPQIIEPATRS